MLAFNEKNKKPTGFDHKVRQIKHKKKGATDFNKQKLTPACKTDPGLHYLSSLRITTSARNL